MPDNTHAGNTHAGNTQADDMHSDHLHSDHLHADDDSDREGSNAVAAMATTVRRSPAGNGPER